MSEAFSDDGSTPGATLVADPRSDVGPGALIAGRYRIERLLGRGGMGAVYEARTEDGGAFALKVIRASVRERRGDEAVRRFLREATAVAQIDHPHVTRVIDAGTDEARGVPFLVMELLEGRDLAQLLRARGPLEPAGVIPLFVQACAGLAAAHARGVIHRDIKPANIYIQDLPGGALGAKVCDFGLAKEIGLSEERSELTQSGGMLGSPLYMSPEQARSAKGVDHRTDIFSLAVTLYETLTGLRPWSATAVGEIVLALWSSDPRPIRVVAPWIDAKLAAVIHTALARDPARRFPSAEAFGAALAPFGSSTVTLAALSAISVEKKGMAKEVGEADTIAASMAGTPEATSVKSGHPTSATWAASRGRRVRIAASLIAILGVLSVGAYFVSRPPARWWTGARATIAIPVGSSLPPAGGRACPSWFSGALAEGLSARLSTAARVRVIGARALAQLTNPWNANVLRGVLGADAFVEARCEDTGSGNATIRLDVVSTAEGARRLAHFEVTGPEGAPSDLVDRIAEKMRSALGLEALAPGDASRAPGLPASPESVRAYVEGLGKLDSHDAARARELLTQVVATQPAFAPAHQALGEALSALGRKEEGAREVALSAKAADALPTEERLVAEGEAEVAAFQWGRAIDTYRAIVRVFPDRTDVALKLVQLYQQAGRERDAEEAIKSFFGKDGVSDRATRDPRVVLASAQVADAVGAWRGAAEAAERARSLAAEDGMRDVEVEALLAACRALNRTAAIAAGDEACAQAEALAGEIGDKGEVVRVLRQEGYLAALRGRFAEGLAISTRALAIATEAGNAELRATALIARANVTKRKGDFPATLLDARAARVAADESGDANLQAHAYIMLAGILLDSGVVEEAGDVYEEGLALTRAMGNELSSAIILQNLGTFWMTKGDIGKARETAREAIEIERRLGDAFDVPWSLDEVGEIEVEAGDPAAARTDFEEAIALFQKLQQPTANGRDDLSMALLALGDAAGALREATAAADEAHERGAITLEAEALTREAHALLAAGDAKKALATVERALVLARQGGEGTAALEPLRVRALFLAGHVDEALAAGRIAPKEVMTRREMRLVMDELWMRRGEIDRATGDLQALAVEARASGHARIERAANAILARKVDEGYR